MKKRLVMVFTVVLMLVLFSHMPSSTKAATSYSSLTSDSIKQKEEQIKQAEQQKKSLQNSLTDVKAIKKKLEQEKSNLKNYVQELDAQLAEVQDNITRLTAEIQQKEEEIRITQEELAEAKQIEEDQYDAMVERIRFMYEQGESSYIDIIFSGESLSSIMNAVEYMEQISAYDRKQLDQFILNRQYIELCEQQLEAEKEVLDETKVSVEQEQKALEELIAAKEQTIREYEYDISNREQAIKEYEADYNDQAEHRFYRPPFKERYCTDVRRRAVQIPGGYLYEIVGRLRLAYASHPWHTEVSQRYRPGISQRYGDLCGLRRKSGSGILQQFHG